jgi:response regulator NasT
MRALNVAVAEGTPEGRESLRQLLAGLGHQVVAAGGGRQLAELCRASPPDLVIADARLPDGGGIAAAGLLAAEHPVPVILVADRAEELPAGPETDYVLGHLVRPLRPADVQAALGLALLRFAKLQALRQALEDCKLVERAKGAVMRRLGLGEEEAFLRLRKLSNSRSRKLVEVARAVVEAEEVFRELADCGRGRPAGNGTERRVTMGGRRAAEGGGEGGGAPEVECDLVRELDRRLRALRRYERHLGGAGGDAEILALWGELKRQDLENVRRLQALLIRHIRETCA